MPNRSSASPPACRSTTRRLPRHAPPWTNTKRPRRRRSLQVEADGADILDVGGESARPGADAVRPDAELARGLPVIRALAGRIRIPFSIATHKTAVATAAIDAGAKIINDVSGPAGAPG